VALWIEGHNAGQPLSFLDHHVKCGDSLVGVFDLKVLEEGIPDGAYKAVEGDDKAAAKHYRVLNRETKKNHPTLPQFKLPEKVAAALEALSHRDERTPEDVAAKEREYAELVNIPAMQNLEHACNAWTAAFFVPLRMPELRGRDLVPTTSTVWERLSGRQIYGPLDGEIVKARFAHSFFHWPVEFPEAFARGGLDAVLGNPPWERITLQQKEFFATREPEIAHAKNKAEREKLIKQLAQRKPALADDWIQAVHGAEGQSKFARESSRYPLTGLGDINTSALFAEAFLTLCSPRGRAGLILPTGILSDDTTKEFFQDIISNHHLQRALSFENEEFLFRGIANVVRYTVLTLLATGGPSDLPRFAFYIRRPEQIAQKERYFSLTPEEIELLSPNTKTCPVFRTERDSEITKKIYRLFPILVNDRDGDHGNHFAIRFLRMFDMASDSDVFRDRKWFQDRRANLDQMKWHLPSGDRYLPLYEAKFVWHYDHRFGSYHTYGRAKGRGGRGLPPVTEKEHSDPNFKVEPRYWVEKKEIESRLASIGWKHRWLLGWRDVTSAKLERSFVASFVPRQAVGHKLLLMLPALGSQHAVLLLANFCSIPFDFIARQKIGGTSMNYSIVKQLPVIPASAYSPSSLDFIVPRVLELAYTAWDLSSLAEDLHYSGGPFIWNPLRRAVIRAELDAHYARLYQLSREELQYILDPSDVYGPEYPGETFRVLKVNEVAELGEYRTKRVILEIYDEMEQAKRTGRPYQTRLDPPPGDLRAAHQPLLQGRDIRTQSQPPREG
jgi:hypothetical protein